MQKIVQILTSYLYYFKEIIVYKILWVFNVGLY